MTDISNWTSYVFIMRTPGYSWLNGKEDFEYQIDRLMVPLNQYQMANLIDAISQVADNGDWYGEFCDIVYRGMKVAGFTELRANSGRVFTLEQVQRRDIRDPQQVIVSKL